MLPISERLGLAWAEGVPLANPIELAWRIFTLHQTYYLVDVPLLYALLLGIAPLALVLLWAGRAGVVLVASWGIWLGYQVFPGATILPWPIDGNYLFQFAAWQVLFFTGMILGYERSHIGSRITARSERALFVAAGLGCALLVVVYEHPAAGLGPVQAVIGYGLIDPADVQTEWFGKANLGVGRIIASAVVFTFAFLLVTHAWRPLRWSLGWLLLPLGQNALLAYTAHVLLSLVVEAVPSVGKPSSVYAQWDSAVLQIIGVGVIWAATCCKGLLLSHRARHVWLASPAVLTLTLLLFPLLGPAPAAPAAQNAAAPRAAGPDDAAARRARAFGTPLPAISRPTPTAAEAQPPRQLVPRGLAAAQTRAQEDVAQESAAEGPAKPDAPHDLATIDAATGEPGQLDAVARSASSVGLAGPPRHDRRHRAPGRRVAGGHVDQ